MSFVVQKAERSLTVKFEFFAVNQTESHDIEV